MRKIVLLSIMGLAISFLSSCNSDIKTTTNTINNIVDTSTMDIETTTTTIKELPYTAAFYNYDYELIISFKVEKEEDAIYSGDVPIKPSDDEFNYEFTGFVKDDSLDGDFSFIATFKEVPKNDWNKVTWF